MAGHDYDWLVIGSGFGGATAALRLAEKGYRVGVLECGRRFRDEDFAETTWQMSRYYWMPKLGLKGILRLTLFRDIFIASGCGVGGGSLGYANTLYRARPAFYADPQIAGLADWESELAPHYDEAERMLGVVTYDQDTPADLLLKEYAEQGGFVDTYAKTRVGVFLGDAGETVPDPFFGGEGPERTGCVRCGSCMVGCRYGAKNTLVKNYLHFAERRGVEILPERTVVDVRPLGAADGSDGYAVTHERSGAWLRRDRRTLTARGVVVAAGALGTNRLLFGSKLRGSLPNVSDRLGCLVRTNSESILAVTARDDARDFTRGVAITSSVYPDPDTHIEPVTYGQGADSQSLLFALMTEAGGRGTQPLALLANMVRHPLLALRASRIKAWSRRTVDPAGDADARQRDAPEGQAPLAQRQRRADDRAGSRQPQPGQDPGRLPGRRVDRGQDRRHAAGDVHGGDLLDPDDRAHPRRRGDRPRPRQRRRGRAPPGLRLREPARLRRL